MTECYDWYVPTPPPIKEDAIKVGDKVEIINPWNFDRECGIKIGDIAKVTFSEDGYIRCTNPSWDILSHKKGRTMAMSQVKLVKKPREDLL